MHVKDAIKTEQNVTL